jgi:gas vesicle protein
MPNSTQSGKKGGSKNSTINNTNVQVGIAAAAVVAAAAGAYFLYGSKDAKKNRRVIKGWMLRAKGEVLEKMEKMKENVTEEAYNKIVDAVATKYGSMKDASAEEVEALSKELKSHWKNIQGHFTKKPAKRKSATRKNRKAAPSKSQSQSGK